MFRKYNINKCIQKITFLAQVNAETGFFSISHEELSKYLSSRSKYKGRGLIQLTGDLNKAKTSYDVPGPYEKYGKYIGDENKFINNPNLIATNLHYTVDSSGWEWSVSKRALTYTKDYKNASKNADAKWKQETFPKGVGKTLNEIALAYEETGEEKYFWFQSKILNGYSLSDRNSPDPHGWSKRKEGLRKLKQWFKYDKNICNGEKELDFKEGRAPWIIVAWEEYNKYKSCYEKDSSLKEKISEYFRLTGNPNLKYSDPWCGAFIQWCFYNTKDYKDTNPIGAAAARDWGPKGNPYLMKGKDGWLNGEECEPFYGAVAVFKNISHVAFIVGYNSKTKKYVYLGGNQGGGDTRPGYQKIRLGSASKSSFLYIMKPKGYLVSDEEKKLPENPETAQDTHNSTR